MASVVFACGEGGALVDQLQTPEEDVWRAFRDGTHAEVALDDNDRCVGRFYVHAMSTHARRLFRCTASIPKRHLTEDRLSVGVTP